ncbi:hypothetical protein A6A06_38605 [Streptomyces sp. CB02923]|nr:hypothetical protein A6A06_38605 [Streptomyces sp. CB02923]
MPAGHMPVVPGVRGMRQHGRSAAGAVFAVRPGRRRKTHQRRIGGSVRAGGRLAGQDGPAGRILWQADAQLAVPKAAFEAVMAADVPAGLLQGRFGERRLAGDVGDEALTEPGDELCGLMAGAASR